MTSNSRELVQSMLDGEIHRYAEVVRRFDDRMRFVVCRKIRDPGTIDDLVQETFYRAFRNLDQLDDPDRLESWLITIARNCTADHIRKTRCRDLHEMQRGQLQTTHHAVEAPLSTEKGWVWEEVAGLPGDFCKILHMRYEMRMSYKEIATRLNVPESTVRGRIFEARKALRVRLIKKGFLS